MNYIFQLSTSLLCAMLLGGSVLGQFKSYEQDKDPEETKRVSLSIWNDPAFKKQFAESYLAETDIEPRVTVDERKTMQKVLDLLATDKGDKAEALLEQFSGEVHSAVFDFTRANILYQSDQLPAAKIHYQNAITKYPKFRRAWKNLGLIHVRSSEFHEAARAFSHVISLGGSDALSFGLLGYSYANLDQDIAAESAYRMATLLDPETMDWKMGLARSFFRQKRYAEAASFSAALIDEYPDNTDLWLLQANAFIGLEQPMKAAENYELVGRMGAATPASMNMLGDIYVNEGLFSLGVQAYVDAMEQTATGSSERVLRAAKILNGNGAHAETELLLDRIEGLRANVLSPEERKELLKLRARLALSRGAGDEEARVLEQVIQLDPLDGDALILLGQHARRTQKPEQAAFYFEQAAGIEGFERQAKIRHAQLLVSESRYKQALQLLRRALDLKPDENLRKYLEQIERLD